MYVVMSCMRLLLCHVWFKKNVSYSLTFFLPKGGGVRLVCLHIVFAIRPIDRFVLFARMYCASYLYWKSGRVDDVWMFVVRNWPAMT